MLIRDPVSLWVILTPDPPMTVQVSGRDVSALETCSVVWPACRDLSVSSRQSWQGCSEEAENWS